MRKSNSFTFTLRSDPREELIHLGERRSLRLLLRILRGGSPAREVPVREKDNPRLYWELLQLLRNRGLPLPAAETMPTAVEPIIGELTRQDPREQLVLGVDPAGERVELDLVSYTHAFIGGPTGGGRTVLLETIFDQAVLSDRVELWVADGLRVDFAGYPLREQDRYAHRPEELAEMLQDLLIEARSRKQRLEDESKRSYLELQDSPRAIFLGISEATRFFGDREGLPGSEAMLLEELSELFGELLKLSPGLGIHVFVESARLRLSESLEELMDSFQNRILVGRSDSRVQRYVLGALSEFSDRLLLPRGRAVRGLLGGGQELFQGYRVPRKVLESELGATTNRAYSYGGEQADD